MKINLIQNNYNYCTFNNTTQIRHNTQIKPDYVSFGSTEVENLTPIQQTAMNAGRQLMRLQRSNDLNNQNISVYLNSISPVPINVMPISELPVQGVRGFNVSAHMLPAYGADNLELAYANIYLKDAKNAKEAGDLIANTAHEFAHVLQRHGDKTYYGIKNYTNNPEEIATIAQQSQYLYNDLCLQFSNAFKENKEFFNKLRDNKVPTTKEIEEYFKDSNMIKDTKKIADSYIKMFTVSPTARRMSINENYGKECVGKLIKNWIIKEAQNEAEAYRVSVETLKQWGKFDFSKFADRNIMHSINKVISELF